MTTNNNIVNNIADVQGFADNRQIPIQKVGIKSVKHPVTLQNRKLENISSISMSNLYVSLPADKKGTHMSRFIEIINNPPIINVENISFLLNSICEKLGSENAFIEMEMPFFVNKSAPVSGMQSLMDYQIRFNAEIKNGVKQIWQEILVPVTSLCPCSKQISEYGAHNQRSHIIVSTLLTENLDFEDVIDAVEAQASCELYGVLKRPDEKFVTEKAYDNPKFVEDLVRDVAKAIHALPKVLAYRVSSENFESIHNHSAFAIIEVDKR